MVSFSSSSSSSNSSRSRSSTSTNNTSNSAVWHPNTQMSEWSDFDSIVRGKGMWLIDSKGHKMLDGVASMWCNVWGHSNPEMIQAINKQLSKLQHAPLFNLTHLPIETLAKKLVALSPGMYKAFFSDNGSSAMEIAFKMALQYWKNVGNTKKTKIATLEGGYHGDTFGAMSVGYVPQFFKKFQNQLFSTMQFPAPNPYRMLSSSSSQPPKTKIQDLQDQCLDKIEDAFIKKGDAIAAFVMESGAQLAGGVIIFPKGFQSKIQKLCKKYDVLFVLDEIATGFGRLGSMVQYTEQKGNPDIVAYGKMLTGGYLTMGATLATKKIYNSFLGKFDDWVHLFHGHTYTGNPVAAASAVANLQMYEKYDLIKKIAKTSRVFASRISEISQLETVGDVRHKSMLMGIELVSNKKRKMPIKCSGGSINKVYFEQGRANGIYLRTLGNILMLVPPLAISESELSVLVDKAIKTVKDVQKNDG